MMKKLLFLAIGGALAFSANAQRAYNQSMVMTSNENAQATVDKKYSVSEMRQLTSYKNDAAHKGTAVGGTRTYNYIDLVDANNNTPAQSLPYMWQNGEGMGVYSNTGGGLMTDTISYMGFGAVLHPWFTLFNDKFALDYAGKVEVRGNTSYVVDTVAFYGIYGQNSAKTSIVDTLRVALIYGDGTSATDISISRWWSNDGSFKTNFNADTLRLPTVRFDSAASAPEGANRIIKNIPLDANWKYDTLANGVHRFAIPFGTTIPAGNLVGAFAYFISGDPNKPAPYTDTIFRGNAVAGLEAFKFNMLRPMMYGENDNAYPKYLEGNYNTGYGLTRIYDTGASLYETYIPHFFWNQESNIEHPYMDWVVSCATCFYVDVANVEANLDAVKVYPNPSTTETRVSFKLNKAADVTVTMTSLMGQVLNHQTFDDIVTGEAVFNTSGLANGIYLMNIESDGFKRVERFTVNN